MRNQRRQFILIAVFCLSFSPARSQGSFVSLTTVHFDVQYQREIPDSDAQKVADYLQQDYGYLSQKLGIDFKKKLEVRIYGSEGKFLTSANQKRPWRAAIYWRGVLHMQPVRALLTRNILEQSLSFELANALLEQTAGQGCPRWLRESFAVYHSGMMANLTAPIGVRLASFSDLDQDLQSHPNPPQLEDVRFILGMTMKFFVEEFGEEKAFGIFKMFNGSTPIEDLFRRSFKQEFATIERTWANYVAAGTDNFRKTK